MKTNDLKEIITKLNLASGGGGYDDFSKLVIFHNGQAHSRNESMMVKVTLPVELKTVSGGIYLADFARLVSSLPVDSEIVVLDGKDEITIRSKSPKLKVAFAKYTVSAGMAPETAVKYTKLDDGFHDTIKTLSDFAGHNTAHPLLMSVHIENGYAEACDAFAYVRLKTGVKESFMVSALAMSKLVGYELSAYTIQDNILHLKGPGFVTSVRLTEGAYPNTSIIREGLTPKMKIKIPAGMNDVLTRASMFVERGTTPDKTALIALEDSTMTIQNESSFGKYNEKIKLVATVKEKIQFKINISALRTICEHAKEICIGENKLFANIQNEGVCVVSLVKVDAVNSN